MAVDMKTGLIREPYVIYTPKMISNYAEFVSFGKIRASFLAQEHFCNGTNAMNRGFVRRFVITFVDKRVGNPLNIYVRP